MEETPTENFAPQEPAGSSDAPTTEYPAPPAQPAVETAAPPAAAATAPPAASLGETTKRRNRLLIPLIVVSIVAVLLLASTITLAIAGDFSGHDGRQAPSQFGNQPMAPMQGPNSGGQMGRPSMPGNQGNSDQQQNNQDQRQPQTSPPESQSQ